MTTRAEPADPFVLVTEALKQPREAITIEAEIYRVHGWDSLGHIDVILSLERAYGISLDDAAVEKYKTMRAIVELYERFRSAGNG